MQLENQVVSLELAKRLKELGVKQESLFYWTSFEPGSYILAVHIGTTLFSSLLGLSLGNRDGEYDISAFTVAELGEMLPSSMRFPFANGRLRAIKQHLHIFKGWDDKGWFINYTAAGTRRLETIKADTEADARAKMLIYLLENKLITL